MEEKRKKSDEEGWVWVVVCEKGDNSHYLGLYNKDDDTNIIPAFSSRDEANDCFLSLPREKGQKYEVQAVHIDELATDARNNGFTVTMVDGDGNIIK